MPLDMLPTDIPLVIDVARDWQEEHRPRRTLFGRQRCQTCRKPWGRFGCGRHLVAVDLLTTLSGLLVDNRSRPPSPRPGRHRPEYTSALVDALTDLARACRLRATATRNQVRQPARPRPSTRAAHWRLG